MKSFRGNYFGIKGDIITNNDPTEVPVNAKRGTLIRYIPADINESPKNYIKTKDGNNTDVEESGGGDTPAIDKVVFLEQNPTIEGYDAPVNTIASVVGEDGYTQLFIKKSSEPMDWVSSFRNNDTIEKTTFNPAEVGLARPSGSIVVGETGTGAEYYTFMYIKGLGDEFDWRRIDQDAEQNVFYVEGKPSDVLADEYDEGSIIITSQPENTNLPYAETVFVVRQSTLMSVGSQNNRIILGLEGNFWETQLGINNLEEGTIVTSKMQVGLTPEETQIRAFIRDHSAINGWRDLVDQFRVISYDPRDSGLDMPFLSIASGLDNENNPRLFRKIGLGDTDWEVIEPLVIGLGFDPSDTNGSGATGPVGAMFTRVFLSEGNPETELYIKYGEGNYDWKKTGGDTPSGNSNLITVDGLSVSDLPNDSEVGTIAILRNLEPGNQDQLGHTAIMYVAHKDGENIKWIRTSESSPDAYVAVGSQYPWNADWANKSQHEGLRNVVTFPGLIYVCQGDFGPPIIQSGTYVMTGFVPSSEASWRLIPRINVKSTGEDNLKLPFVSFPNGLEKANNIKVADPNTVAAGLVLGSLVSDVTEGSDNSASSILVKGSKTTTETQSEAQRSFALYTFFESTGPVLVSADSEDSVVNAHIGGDCSNFSATHSLMLGGFFGDVQATNSIVIGDSTSMSQRDYEKSFVLADLSGSSNLSFSKSLVIGSLNEAHSGNVNEKFLFGDQVYPMATGSIDLLMGLRSPSEDVTGQNTLELDMDGNLRVTGKYKHTVITNPVNANSGSVFNISNSTGTVDLQSLGAGGLAHLGSEFTICNLSSADKEVNLGTSYTIHTKDASFVKTGGNALTILAKDNFASVDYATGNFPSILKLIKVTGTNDFIMVN